MAVLSSKTTSGEESFTKYVVKNPRYNEIDFEVEEKMTAGLITKSGSQYKVVKEWGPDHKKKFTVGVFLNDEKIAEGEGFSKQEAEEEAAKEALKVKNWNK